jgi:hypothetical protein
MEAKETAIARQWLSKHVPAATDIYATTEKLLEAVFSMQCVPRLYNEHQCDKSVSCELGAVSGQIVKLGVSIHS